MTSVQTSSIMWRLLCSRTIATRIIRSIFMTRFHNSKLSSKSIENGSVMHIHSMKIIKVTFSRFSE